jgi:hypothetical protein
MNIVTLITVLKVEVFSKLFLYFFGSQVRIIAVLNPKNVSRNFIRCGLWTPDALGGPSCNTHIIHVAHAPGRTARNRWREEGGDHLCSHLDAHVTICSNSLSSSPVPPWGWSSRLITRLQIKHARPMQLVGRVFIFVLARSALAC